MQNSLCVKSVVVKHVTVTRVNEKNTVFFQSEKKNELVLILHFHKRYVPCSTYDGILFISVTTNYAPIDT